MYRTKVKHHLIQFFLLLALISSSACQTETNHSQQFLQFGTLIDITLASTSEEKANNSFAEIEALLVKRHSDWHGWEDGSLTRFNKALHKSPDKGIPVPDNLQRLIKDSKKYYQISDGLFNPALGKLIGAWGFHDHSEADMPLINEIKKNIPGMDDLHIRNQLAYSGNPHLQLDFGGIAKGLAIEEIQQLLAGNGIENFIINAGGDILAAGQNGQRNWRVAIQDPFKEDVIGTIELAPSQSIFTSGNYRRFQNQPDHKKRHHIINPKTGEPSLYISSATVITNDPVLADAAATTLMLGGKEQIKDLASALGIQQYMVITEQSEVIISQSMYDKLAWHEEQQFKIQIQ
jgi:FAD:protein FMN transferase